MKSGFIKTNGQNLYYEIQGNGEPFILIQGLSGNTSSWYAQVPNFKKYFKTITFDNRDIGRSSKAEYPYSISDMADDTAGLMDKLGIKKAHILGISMGGMIAQELCLRHPDKVDRLLLSCTMAQMKSFSVSFVHPWNFIVHNDPDGKALISYVITMVMTHKFQQNAEAIAALIKRKLSNPYPQNPNAFSRQANALSSHNALSRLNNITNSTLIIVGDQDILTPSWSAKEVAAAIPGAKLEIIPGGGHCLFWEIPDRFNRTVIDFLKA